MFRQFAVLHPDQALSRIEPYLNASFADSLIVVSAHQFPSSFYNYASAAATPIGKKIRSIDDTLVKLITGIADESAGRLIFPFITFNPQRKNCCRQHQIYCYRPTRLL